MEKDSKPHPLAAVFLLALVFVASFGAYSGDRSQRPIPRGGHAEREHESYSSGHHERAQDAQGAAPRAIQAQDAPGQDRIGPNPKEESEWYARPDWWIAGATGALFLATTGLWIFTGLMWGATRQLVLGAKDTAQRQLRAYVCDVRGQADLIAAGKIIRIHLNFKNTGQTPAYNVEIYRDGADILPLIDVPFERRVPFAPVNTIMAPGSEFEVLMELTQIAPDSLSFVQNSTRAIFVWGRVIYADAFGATWHFNYRCVAFGPGVSWRLIPHVSGYEAT
jgi:hypothetical protein